MPVAAILAGAARHFRRDEGAVARFEARHLGTDFDDLASHLVSLDERCAREPVPLDEVRAADAARMHADEHFPPSGLLPRPFLDANVAVVVPDGGFHRLFAPSALSVSNSFSARSGFLFSCTTARK